VVIEAGHRQAGRPGTVAQAGLPRPRGRSSRFAERVITRNHHDADLSGRPRGDIRGAATREEIDPVRFIGKLVDRTARATRWARTAVARGAEVTVVSRERRAAGPGGREK